MNGDWLDIAEYKAPEKVGLPAFVALPDDYASRSAILEQCWSRLTVRQKTFLGAWRECRYNARAAERLTGIDRRVHSDGQYGEDYATVVRIWRANAAASALDRDRLLARQDDIVETLLTPKPILHQGEPTGFEEVEAGAAARANETLLQAAGVIKTNKDVEVNVGVAVHIGPPTLNIQVMPLPPSKAAQRESVVIDAKFTEVPSDGWLDA